jgi:hypothetical protein
MTTDEEREYSEDGVDLTLIRWGKAVSPPIWQQILHHYSHGHDATIAT